MIWEKTCRPKGRRALLSERLAVVILAGIDEFTARARLTCCGRGGDETRRTAGREGISRLHFFF